MAATPLRVRTAEHAVIGLGPDSVCVRDEFGLRSFICHCFFKGGIANDSNFGLARPPPISMDVEGSADPEARMWRFDPSDAAWHKIFARPQRPVSFSAGSVADDAGTPA